MTEQAKHIEVRLMAMEAGEKTVSISIEVERARTSAIIKHNGRYFVYAYMAPGFNELVFMEVSAPTVVDEDQPEQVRELNELIKARFPNAALTVVLSEGNIVFRSDVFATVPDSLVGNDGEPLPEASDMLHNASRNIHDWLQVMAARGVTID